MLTVTATGEKLRVEGQFGFTSFYAWSDVELFTFANGTSWTDLDVAAKLAIGTAGDERLLGTFRSDQLDGKAGTDVLEGGDGSDTYLFGRGYGPDTIVETVTDANLPDSDTLRFGVDVLPSDIAVSRNENDLILTIVGTQDVVTIKGQWGQTAWFSWTDIENFAFADGTVWTKSEVAARMNAGTPGDDVLIGTGGNDRLDGAAGNDRLEAGEGSDTYVFGRGYGQDTIREHVDHVLIPDDDRVVFQAGIDADDLVLSRNGDDLIVALAGTQDKITIQGQFSQLAGYSWHDIERFEFADGTFLTKDEMRQKLLSGTPGDDHIVGFGSHDVIDGGPGNDTLEGGEGSDTYRFGFGDGRDLIIETLLDGRSTEDDTLAMKAGVNPSDVTVSRTGQDMIFTLTSGETIRVQGQYNEGASEFLSYNDVERVTFADGTVWSKSEIDRRSLHATAGDDVLLGSFFAQVYRGLSGNDQLEGGRANDTYIWARGDGADVIVEGPEEGSGDTLVLEGINSANVTVTRSGADATIVIAESASGAGDGGSVVLRKSLDAYYNQGVDRVVFEDGVVWTQATLRQMLISSAGTPGDDVITGTSSPDIIAGGRGNDTLNGAGGSDTYIWARGDGADRITETVENGNFDKLILEGVNAGDVTVSANGINATLTIAESTPGAGDGGSIVLDHTFDEYYGQGVDQIAFADGVVWTRSDLRAAYFRSASTPLNDTISGFNTNDTIRAGKGEDALNGQGASDIYIWARGDGNDRITEWVENGNSDKLILEGVNPGAITVGRNGNTATLTIAESAPGAGDGGVVVLEHTFDDYYGQGLDLIAFADDTVWTRSELRAAYFRSAITPGDDNVSGFNTNDAIRAGAGNDLLSGGAGSDTYFWARGDGADRITEWVENGYSDKLVLEGVDPAAVTIGRSGNTATLTIAASAPGAGDGGSIVLEHTFDEYYGQGVDLVSFADGTVWSRGDLRTIYLRTASTSGADEISGFNTNDTMRAGAGNDLLNGQGGSDTYLWARGDGSDRITEWVENGYSDKLILEGIRPSEVTAGRNGNTVTLTIAESAPGVGDGGSIILENTFDDYYGQGLDLILFADGTLWNRTDLQTVILQAASTSGNDTLIGGSGNDNLNGFGGDDILYGNDGDDLLAGGIGNDIIYGGPGSDTLLGGAGDDLLLPETGIDRVEGGDGFDVVDIRYFWGDVTVDLRAGSNQADFRNGAFETWIGVEGVVSGEGSDLLIGNDLVNRLSGTDGNDRIEGNGGNDLLIGGSGGDELLGGAGDDVILPETGGDRVDGGDGSDTVDVVYFTGDITVDLRLAENQADFHIGAYETWLNVENVISSSGNDTLLGNDVANTLSGNGGDDRLEGNGGNDVLNGGDGADVLIGGLGHDTLAGGDGIDTADYSTSTGDLTINLGLTISQLITAGETETLTGVENLLGGSGNDALIGSASGNMLKGGAGADRLTGGLGDDSLDGGLGMDVAVFAGSKASYSIVTSGGTTTIKDNATTTDGDDGTDTLVGIETAQFKDGSQGIAAPIILDLDGNGVRATDQGHSKIKFDWDGDGKKNATGWVGKGDGLLVFDRNGDGKMSGADELSFVNDKAGAKSDLDGLTAFDSNADELFSSLDEQWSSFRVWVDNDTDGKVDKKELRSMADVGIASINLAGQAVDRTWDWGETVTVNTGTFTRMDGSIGGFSDVALSYAAGPQPRAVSLDMGEQLASDLWSGLYEHRAFDGVLL